MLDPVRSNKIMYDGGTVEDKWGEERAVVRRLVLADVIVRLLDTCASLKEGGLRCGLRGGGVVAVDNEKVQPEFFGISETRVWSMDNVCAKWP